MIVHESEGERLYNKNCPEIRLKEEYLSEGANFFLREIGVFSEKKKF